MRKFFVLIACWVLPFSVRGGDFKRFYPANAGERIVSLTALPGGGLWLKSQGEKGGGVRGGWIHGGAAMDTE